ncbi:unnamed protein product [Cuscuta campestris]|uniref:F-box domain-containing protein n=1 Tax=Cuscuta campestris TaxID=132261 RepID=A0A484N9Q1_9ASTE|nr:unnamed protein product [Cuscuta campestris]
MSQLPDEILEYILSKLILRDAVRASLVSSRWRHHVLSRPCLIFKTCSMFKIEGASEEKCVCSEYKDRFVRAVYDFLASYRGVRMKKLSVHFCLMTVSKNVVSDWMRVACDLGVEDVVFEICCEYLESKVRLRGTRLVEIFPSTQPIVLKYLRLSGFNAFAVSLFTRLQTLNLYYTSLDSHVMESVLSSGLVNLKMLRFKHSKLPPYLSLNSLPNLQHFVANFCSGLEKIDVASLKLKRLKANCNRTVSVGLTRVPNLKRLSYMVHDGPSICHIFSKLPQILPRLTSLHVCSSSNWVEHIPESIATFSKLRSLKLPLASKVEDIMFKIVQFLKSCPRLSDLTIGLRPSPREDKEHEKLECIDDDDYHHKHLKWIKIHGFARTKNQIEFCKYLLKLAPRMKKLILPHCLKECKHQVNEEEREAVINALKPFLKGVKLLVL